MRGEQTARRASPAQAEGGRRGRGSTHQVHLSIVKDDTRVGDRDVQADRLAPIGKRNLDGAGTEARHVLITTSFLIRAPVFGDLLAAAPIESRKVPLAGNITRVRGRIIYVTIYALGGLVARRTCGGGGRTWRGVSVLLEGGQPNEVGQRKATGGGRGGNGTRRSEGAGSGGTCRNGTAAEKVRGRALRPRRRSNKGAPPQAAPDKSAPPQAALDQGAPPQAAPD